MAANATFVLPLTLANSLPLSTCLSPHTRCTTYRHHHRNNHDLAHQHRGARLRHRDAKHHRCLGGCRHRSWAVVSTTAARQPSLPDRRAHKPTAARQPLPFQLSVARQYNSTHARRGACDHVPVPRQRAPEHAASAYRRKTANRRWRVGCLHTPMAPALRRRMPALQATNVARRRRNDDQICTHTVFCTQQPSRPHCARQRVCLASPSDMLACCSRRWPRRMIIEHSADQNYCFVTLERRDCPPCRKQIFTRSIYE